MIKLINLIRYHFSRRGKLRRQHVPLDSNLKDLTSAQIFEKQIQQQRKIFQASIPDQTLTQTLKQQNPKLKQRFKVDRQDLQKKVGKVIKSQLKVERIIPAAEDQTFETIDSKSFLHNQAAEIQFEQKFRTELFKKKQTNRMIQKEKNDFRNYLQEPKNKDFKVYEENLKRFKNSRIESMMNFRRNNEQLRLLIDSGYIDNPQNLGIIIDKMNQTPRLENKQGNTFQNNSNEQPNHVGSSNHSSNTEIQQSAIQHHKQTQLSAQIQSMHNQMVQNINGPSQLRNPNLLQEFFNNLEQSTQLQKQKARQDLELIKKIKQYETEAFESRYNSLNFRFKGQVNFDWMKQSELLSYIKTERTPLTQPQGLLQLYSQNKDKQSKFNLPIITPTVMSRIYSVCSLFEFPQTDENNRINMLNDKKYIDLEKNLFKNCHQLSDQNFADAVFAYAKNHKEQQGLLKLKMNDKIIQTIFVELGERVGSLEEEDLGLVLRSILHTPILKNQKLNWTPIVQSMSQRLPLLEKDYQFQSVISFLTLVPVTQTSISAIRQNLSKYRSYKWQAKQTLESFLQCSSFLIRYQSTLPTHQSRKMIQQMKYLFCSKYQEIMPITQQLSINTMPQLMSVMYYLERNKQPEAKYEIQVPNKLVNKCKKEIIDNVRMQKQPIKKYTVANVTMSMALMDYCKALVPNHESRQLKYKIMQISTLKSLFPFRPLPFNSINYFTYHEMIKLANNEIVNLPVKFIAQTIFANSLVRYKNEGIMEEIMGKVVEKIYFEIKQAKQQEIKGHERYAKEYVLMVCSFHHSRMITKYYSHFMNILVQLPLSSFINLEPNLLLRFFESVVTLSFTTDPRNQEDFMLIDHFSKVFQTCYEDLFKGCVSVLNKEEILVLDFVSSMFRFFRLTNQTKGQSQKKFSSIENDEQIQKSLQKFISNLTVEDQYLRNLTTLVKKTCQILQDSNQNQIQPSKLFTPEFTQIQKMFYTYSIRQIMDQEQHIGSQYKYQTVYQNVRRKLIKENSSIKINPINWRIQVKDKKEVYFLATYEHLLAKYEQQNTTVRLFGFWKIYSQIYTRAGWKLRLVCTFLEG